MKFQLFISFVGILLLVGCGPAEPTFQEKIESAVNRHFSDDTVTQVVLIDTVHTVDLEKMKSSVDDLMVSNVKLKNEILAGHERVFDLDIAMQLAFGEEKELLKMELIEQEEKMNAYPVSPEELDSLYQQHDEDFQFIVEALSTFRMNDNIGYYHVSAIIGEQKKYMSISEVTSQDWQVLGAFDHPVLSH